MRVETYVKRTEWGFEIHKAQFDDKGKKIKEYQAGAAHIGTPHTDEDFRRALALADPFAAPPTE